MIEGRRSRAAPSSTGAESCVSTELAPLAARCRVRAGERAKTAPGESSSGGCSTPPRHYSPRCRPTRSCASAPSAGADWPADDIELRRARRDGAGGARAHHRHARHRWQRAEPPRSEPGQTASTSPSSKGRADRRGRRHSRRDIGGAGRVAGRIAADASLDDGARRCSSSCSLLRDHAAPFQRRQRVLERGPRGAVRAGAKRSPGRSHRASNDSMPPSDRPSGGADDDDPARLHTRPAAGCVRRNVRRPSVVHSQAMSPRSATALATERRRSRWRPIGGGHVAYAGQPRARGRGAPRDGRCVTRRRWRTGEQLHLRVAQLPFQSRTIGGWACRCRKPTSRCRTSRFSLVVQSAPTLDVHRNRWPVCSSTNGSRSCRARARPRAMVFEFDQPDAAPPQSLLLAVPPDPAQPWTLWTPCSRCCSKHSTSPGCALVDPEALAMRRPLPAGACTSPSTTARRHRSYDRLRGAGLGRRREECVMTSITSWLRLEPRVPQRRHEHRAGGPRCTTRCGCWRASGRSASSRARTADRRPRRSGAASRPGSPATHRARSLTGPRRPARPFDGADHPARDARRVRAGASADRPPSSGSA